MRRLVNKQLGEPIIDVCCYMVDETPYTAPTDKIVGNETYKTYTREHAVEGYFVNFEIPCDVNVLVILNGLWFDENPPYLADSTLEYYFPNIGENRNLNYDYRVYSCKKGDQWNNEVVDISFESYEEDSWHNITTCTLVLHGENFGEDDNGKRVRVYLVGDDYYA